MLFSSCDSPLHTLGDGVAVGPRFHDLAWRQRKTWVVTAVPARDTDTSTGSPASVAAEPRPHGAYRREETYRKECA